ncbi:MAG: zinc ribbon domain-containing protein [Gemmatimonadota bacterium]
MVFEVAAALVLALLILWLVLEPVVRRQPAAAVALYDPDDDEESRKKLALAAIKEIEFDKATGKLSDADYEMLMAKYTALALEAIRQEEAGVAAGAVDVEAMVAARVRSIRGERGDGRPAAACPVHGPRPEPDAAYCSACGVPAQTEAVCPACSAALAPDSRFCANCGSRVAA